MSVLSKKNMQTGALNSEMARFSSPTFPYFWWLFITVGPFPLFVVLWDGNFKYSDLQETAILDIQTFRKGDSAKCSWLNRKSLNSMLAYKFPLLLCFRYLSFKIQNEWAFIPCTNCLNQVSRTIAKEACLAHFRWSIFLTFCFLKFCHS